MSEELTAAQLHTLRHMLGITDLSQREPRPYRNYAATVPGDPEYTELERLGMVCEYIPTALSGSYRWMKCTQAGREAAIKDFYKNRESKSKRVYVRFLEIHDVMPDLTFKEFLTNPDFKEARKQA